LNVNNTTFFQQGYRFPQTVTSAPLLYFAAILFSVIPVKSTASPQVAPSVYAQRGFLPFVLARLAAVFAVQIQAIVVAWQIYDLTRDPMSLAYVGLAQFLPMFILLMPAGDLIDRYNRKRLLAMSWYIEGICSAILLFLTYTNSHNLVAFYAALVLFGCGRAFTGPALQSMLPQIVPRSHLAQAIAANSLIMRVASIAGPLLGGGLYALGGGALAYSVCIVCFGLGVALLPFVPLLFALPVKKHEAASWQRVTAGIRFIFSHPMILGVISLDLFAVLLGGVVALLPIYAHQVLHVGPEGLGLLRSAIAIGALMTGLYLSRFPYNKQVGMTMFIAVAIFGVANLVFALSSWFWVSFIALFIAGASDMVSVYIRSSLIQFLTPDDMRGRVNAVNMLFIGSSNELGEFRAGTSAAWFGVIPAAVIGGLGTLTVVGTWMWKFKSLRHVNKFEDAL
jgi:MFS family permease